jgi:hypothetical protein
MTFHKAQGMTVAEAFVLGDDTLDSTTGPSSGVLSTQDEVITYTMRMRLTGGNIEFEVINGNSTTWGTFGGQGWLRASVGTDQTGFPLYSPDVSVKNSKVTFARHRVKKFALKEVRYYSNNGTLLGTDTTERIVHQHQAD